MSVSVTGLPGTAPNITNLDQCILGPCSVNHATVSYGPSLAGNVIYIAIFAIVLMIQTILCFVYHTYSYAIAMSAGLVLEIMGYLGRVQIHYTRFLETPFLIYIICLTIAPGFFTCSLYLTLSRVIVHFGPHNSCLSPKEYTVGFVTSDVIALILQAVGGGRAYAGGTQSESQAAINVMVAGLVFQVLSLSCFIILCAGFFRNVRKDKAHCRATDWAAGKVEATPTITFGFKAFLYALATATFSILIRSIFRIAELVHGFSSKLANEQISFMILEGAMVVSTTLLMTVFHPGRYIAQNWRNAGWGLQKNGNEQRQESRTVPVYDESYAQIRLQQGNGTLSLGE